MSKHMRVKLFQQDARLPCCVGDSYKVFSPKHQVVEANSLALIWMRLAIQIPSKYTGDFTDAHENLQVESHLGNLHSLEDEVCIIVKNVEDVDILIQQGEVIAFLIIKKIKTPPVVAVVGSLCEEDQQIKNDQQTRQACTEYCSS